MSDAWDLQKIIADTYERMRFEKKAAIMQNIYSSPGPEEVLGADWQREDRIKINQPTQAFPPVEIIHRILGAPNRFRVNVYNEGWGDQRTPIMHIALLDTGNKQIVRFEEDPATFPSDALIDKLRLLR